MRIQILTIIKKILLKNRAFGTRATEKRKLLDFLESIKPVKTNYDLIRLGGDSDGGYLIPNDIENLEACFSPGVANIADFEIDLAKKGIKCFMADYSIEKLPINNSLFDFEKKYLGSTNNKEYITLENWIESKTSNKSDLILQMDIESSEYSVIFDTPSEILKRFRILVIEFHKLHYMFNPMGFELISLTFEKILKNFEIVHIHPNNVDKLVEYDGISVPPTMEFTFLRKDRITSKTRNLSFPHKLDQANTYKKDDFVLPKCWY